MPLPTRMRSASLLLSTAADGVTPGGRGDDGGPTGNARLRRKAGAPLAMLLSAGLGAIGTGATTASAAPVCTDLIPIGGKGQPVVTKTVGPPKLTPLGLAIGRSNWNTDFAVDRAYSSYRFFFTAISSDPNARYPVQFWMKFSDGSALQLVNETMQPPLGSRRMFGPFPATAGKLTTQMNVKVGASIDPGATGFSYRISVQGCLGF